MLCQCFSGKPYSECCEKFHEFKQLPSPKELVQARFCGYAMKNIDFILKTTHPKNVMMQQSEKQNRREILQFVVETRFNQLKILSEEVEGNVAFVTFEVELEQMGKRVAFREKSRFLKRNGAWFYESGEVTNLS